MDLERWEVHGLHPFDGRDLSVRLGELHARMAGVEGETYR
jgi:hypothetical protein